MRIELTSEQRALQARARDLARGPIAARAAEVDRTEAYPWEMGHRQDEDGRYHLWC